MTQTAQRNSERYFLQGFKEADQQRKTGGKLDAVSLFLGYLDRIQAEAKEVLLKAGYADPLALIRDPLTDGSRFHCSPSSPGFIDLVNLPPVLAVPNKRRRPESHAFELFGWANEMRQSVLRTPPEGREVLVLAFWLGGNVATAQIGMRLPKIGATLRSWQSSDAAARRNGIKSELRQVVEQTFKDISNPTLNTLLDVFEDEDGISDLYESLTDPIHITAIVVDHNSGEVKYRTRRGKEKTVKFESLERMIRDIKDEKKPKKKTKK